MPNGPPFLGWIGDLCRVAFPTHEANAPQPPARMNKPREGDGGFPGLDPCPIHPHVDLHHYPEAHPVLHRRSVQRLHVHLAINGDNGIGVVAEADEPSDLLRVDDLIGNEDAPNARRGHHLGFAELRARNSKRAGRQKLVGQRGDLERLHVGAPTHTSLAKACRHPVDVALYHGQVDHQRGVSSSHSERPVR
jgi:hypothetical protein